MVAWKSSQTWEGMKTHMGYNQEVYDVECMAIAQALGTAAACNLAPKCITITPNTQTANWKMVSDEPGPGQKYALQA